MSITLQLTKPFEFLAQEYTELDLREPKMRDVKQLDSIKGEAAKAIKFVSVLSGLPEVVIEQISAYDMAIVIAPVLAGFMGESPATGEQV